MPCWSGPPNSTVADRPVPDGQRRHPIFLEAANRAMPNPCSRRFANSREHIAVRDAMTRYAVGGWMKHLCREFSPT
jgi:hypothetical protein